MTRDEAIKKIEDLRDDCAERQEAAGFRSVEGRYWEGKRDGFDVALWIIHEVA